MSDLYFANDVFGELDRLQRQVSSLFGGLPSSIRYNRLETFPAVNTGTTARACSHYGCQMRCESKRSCARREAAAGVNPGQVLQRGAWPFWSQPGGNGVQTAPLGVARLGKADALPSPCAWIGAV